MPLATIYWPASWLTDQLAWERAPVKAAPTHRHMIEPIPRITLLIVLELVFSMIFSLCGGIYRVVLNGTRAVWGAVLHTPVLYWWRLPVPVAAQMPVTAVINPLTTPPRPPLIKALIIEAQAQIPTRAAMVKPVARANFEVSYPRLIFASCLVRVVVVMMFSFSGQWEKVVLESSAVVMFRW